LTRIQLQALSSKDISMSRTKSYYDLRDAFLLPGCAVCRVSARAVDRYLDGLLYEKVNDPGLRAALRQARGFCQRHAWGLVRHGAALGVAIMMRDVVRTLQGALADARFRSTPLFSLARVQETIDAQQPRAATAEVVAELGAQAPCPICTYEQEVEGDLLVSFLDNLAGDAGLLDAYRASAGFCLPHFRQALSRIGEERLFVAIVEAQQSIWARLEAQLSELIRKSHYKYSDEALGEEGVSWLRAIAAISGESFGSHPHGDGHRQGEPQGGV